MSNRSFILSAIDVVVFMVLFYLYFFITIWGSLTHIRHCCKGRPMLFTKLKCSFS